jgi:hypothetical protein
MNEAHNLEFKTVSAVLIGGVWHDVYQESFRISAVEAGGQSLWPAAFLFRTMASSEHSYTSTVVLMSGPASTLQALRSA